MLRALFGLACLIGLTAPSLSQERDPDGFETFLTEFRRAE
jgi:hypothetical protein